MIPLTKPSLGEAEANAIRETILSGWVTQGPKVAYFENAICEYTGSGFACATSSCTTGLHLALLGAGVGPGDVVITVSHSFIATANSIRHCMAEPVFVDIDPATFNMDPEALESTICREFEFRDGSLWFTDTDRLAVGESPLKVVNTPTGRLAAILVVHQVGMPADMPSILSIAEKYDLPVIEDAACAIGSEISLDNGLTWERIGRPHGLSAVFSFHPRKVITTGDGGAVTTNNVKFDRLLRLRRHHGMGVDDRTRHTSSQVIVESYLTTGWNYRLTDIQAAVGLVQMGRLSGIVQKRRELASCYHQALEAVPLISPPSTEPAYARTNWQSYIAMLDASVSRDNVIAHMKKKGVQCKKGIMNAHLEPPYHHAWSLGSLPRSESAGERGLILPLYPDMSREDVAYVVDNLAEALRVASKPSV